MSLGEDTLECSILEKELRGMKVENTIQSSNGQAIGHLAKQAVSGLVEAGARPQG